MRLAAVAGILCWGCTSNTVEVDLSTRSGIAFWITVDDVGEVLETSAAFGLEEGRLTFGARHFVEPEETDQVLLALFSPEDLGAMIPEFDEARAVELAPLPQAPDGRPYARFSPPYAVVSALPPSAEIFRLPSGTGLRALEEGDDQLRSRVAIEVPVDPEHCRPTASVPRTFNSPTFADEIEALGAHRVLGAHFLAGEHLLFRTFNLIFLARDDQPFDPTAPGAALFARDLPDVVSPVFRGVSVIEGPTPGSFRAVVALQHAGLDGTNIASIVELEGQDGAITTVRTATTVDVEQADVAMEPSGRYVAVGRDEDIRMGWFGQPGMVVRKLDAQAVGGRAVTTTGVASFPFALTTNTAIYVYDQSGDAWILKRLPLEEGGDTLNVVAASPDGEVWTAGLTGTIFRATVDGPAERIQLELPPRFLPCASDDSDLNRVRSVQDVHDIAMWGDHVLVALAACDVVVAVERSTLCTSLVTPTEVRPTGEDLRFVQAREGRMIFSTAADGLFSLTVN